MGMEKNINGGLTVQGTDNQEINIKNLSKDLAEKILKIHQFRINFDNAGLMEKENSINFDYNQGQYDRGLKGFYDFLSNLIWLDLSDNKADFFARMQLNNYSSVIEVYGSSIHIKNSNCKPEKKEVGSENPITV